MQPKTYRRVSLQVFLHCTLGSFANIPPPEPDTTIVRMYRARRPVREIMEIVGRGKPTIYKVLRRENVPLRTAA